MGKKLMDILKGAAIMGLFAGLYALTGHDLDPQNIVLGVVDLIVGSTGGRTGADIPQLWDQVKVGLLIYGLICTVLFVFSVLYCGKRGIITAACGYFGVLLLITGLGHGIAALYLPVALLAAGYAVAKLMSDRGKLKLPK
jgi:hypothetical protein